jgi:hypothetical protein
MNLTFFDLLRLHVQTLELQWEIWRKMPGAYLVAFLPAE